MKIVASQKHNSSYVALKHKEFRKFDWIELAQRLPVYAQIPCMIKILLAAALIGTVAAVAIIYVQYLADEKYIEDPTMDIWM